LHKSQLQPFFEFDKELPVLGRVWYIAEDADEFVAVAFALKSPPAFNELRLG
jgi:hypothetical protein